MSAKTASAAAFLPETLSLTRLRAAAAGCRGCDLYEYATQTVFGEGPARARLMFVGEQPGDSEDLAGRPFVGPAGRILHDGFEAAGIDPKHAYITNAVKHFKFVLRGKRRIHATPKVHEIRACRPWLEAELEVVRPSLVVALGATAAQTILGSGFRLTQHRGEIFDSEFAGRVLATLHPSAILRAPDQDARDEAMRGFVADLKAVAREVARS
jgi:uracil-DNA glycosylase family protein